MKRVTVRLIMVLMACVCTAQAGITTLYQWHLGDEDNAILGGGVPTITLANVGGAAADLGLASGAWSGNGTVVASASAGWGLSMDGNGRSYYSSSTLHVVPADNHKWGFDAVVKAPGPAAQQYVMSIGIGDASSMILQEKDGYWALHRPGAVLRDSTAAVDTGEHHLVYAGGALYMDGNKITSDDVNADYNTANFTPAAGITIFNGAPDYGNSSFLGAVSFARVFEWTGDFNHRRHSG